MIRDRLCHNRMWGNCAVIAADNTLKSTASPEKQLNNGEFYVTAILCSFGSLHEGDTLESATATSKVSNWCESNYLRARRRGLKK